MTVYLDTDRLRSMDAQAFQTRTPFPWLNEPALLTEEGHARLVATLPDISLFEPVFGEVRKYGQRQHDRFSLDYRDDLPIAQEWKDFVAELRGDVYQDFLRRMYGTRWMDIGFHWHYTPKACSVSPHCDARRKLGSHIFYFNTPDDWDESWGGQTLILDDGGRLPLDSAPDFDAFDRSYQSQSMGNSSLLFMRSGRPWHGVREITAPEGKYRKVFIVVANRDDPLWRLRRTLRGKANRY